MLSLLVGCVTGPFDCSDPYTLPPIHFETSDLIVAIVTPFQQKLKSGLKMEEAAAKEEGKKERTE